MALPHDRRASWRRLWPLALALLVALAVLWLLYRLAAGTGAPTFVYEVS